MVIIDKKSFGIRALCTCRSLAVVMLVGGLGLPLGSGTDVPEVHAAEMKFYKDGVEAPTRKVQTKGETANQARTAKAKYECKRKLRKCVERKNGRCIRYENQFMCWIPDPAANRCDPTLSPSPAPNGIGGCTVVSSQCKEEADKKCSVMQTELMCQAMASGDGVTAQEPQISFAYTEEREGVLEAGCQITAERCVDSAPRDIPVSNWAGHTASANPPCWEKTLEVSCPSDSHANACKALEAAGCTKEKSRTCEQMQDGACVRWSSSYRCRGFEIKGPDIQTDQVTDWTN